ncbi:hypothetical protein MMC30_001291 [Trapelia coarctata]|nr:hypothetical protein [Trapelia coarctata]
MEGRYGKVTGAVYLSLHHPSQRSFALVTCPLETFRVPNDDLYYEPNRGGRTETTFNNQLIEIRICEHMVSDDGSSELLISIRGHGIARRIISTISSAAGFGPALPSSGEAPFTLQEVTLRTHAQLPHTVEGQMRSRTVNPGQDYTINVLAHVKEGGEVWSLIRLERPFLRVEGDEYSLKVLDRAPWLEQKLAAIVRSWGSGEGKLVGPDGTYYVRGL